jgi:protein-tyrosine phosphatase
MIDLHTHILPGIDDGSQTLEDSIKMARIALESGVHTIVVTPHCNREGIFDNYYDETLLDRYLAFESAIAAEQIPLKLALGMEIFGSEEVPSLLQEKRIISLNDSRYLLLEFSFREDEVLIDFLIDELTHQGFIPILAHPERYPYVQNNPRLVPRWIAQGCAIQLNKGSILGSFGSRARDTALHLLNYNLVSMIASDAHSPIRRTTDLSQVYSYIRNHYSVEYADFLLEDNPRCVIENKKLLERDRFEEAKRIYFI